MFALSGHDEIIVIRTSPLVCSPQQGITTVIITLVSVDVNHSTPCQSAGNALKQSSLTLLTVNCCLLSTAAAARGQAAEQLGHEAAHRAVLTTSCLHCSLHLLQHGPICGQGGEAAAVALGEQLVGASRQLLQEVASQWEQRRGACGVALCTRA